MLWHGMCVRKQKQGMSDMSLNERHLRRTYYDRSRGAKRYPREDGVLFVFGFRDEGERK